jgi:molybdopterin-guanine dinucleotide biosynthesis protein A
MASLSPHILGVILAGGKSRRMGGGDKGLMDLDGKSMLAHIIERFRTQVETLIINANGDLARLSQFGVPVIPDLDTSARGPLTGLLAAMQWAKRQPQPLTSIATVPVDVPFLPTDFVARLDAARGKNAAIAQSAGRRHPTIGIWPLDLMDEVSAALDRNELSVDAFAARHGAIAVPFPLRDVGGQTIDPFYNTNTPEDLASVRAVLTDNS